MSNRNHQIMRDVDNLLSRQRTPIRRGRTRRRRQAQTQGSRRGRRNNTRRVTPISINHIVNIKSNISDTKKYFKDVKDGRIDYKYDDYNKKLESLINDVKLIYPRRDIKNIEKLMHGKRLNKRYNFRHNDANEASKLYYSMRRYRPHNAELNRRQGLPEGLNVDSTPTLSRSRSRGLPSRRTPSLSPASPST